MNSPYILLTAMPFTLLEANYMSLQIYVVLINLKVSVVVSVPGLKCLSSFYTVLVMVCRVLGSSNAECHDIVTLCFLL
ncbi:hypothetical protein Lalb_Chr20g0121911 [Lupinus albus]|uniref:Uncharacterized protein n=1 Tax=Lupinus albus TaxID=3870 RepID=A0A6A4NRD0_LUPAL|nr:hypothetical protein Lalb_Chr20g0121911 [Lupinus albus]